MKDYKKLWILPQLNLYQDQPELKKYYNWPPGNSPELCCLDSNLNKDLDKTVEVHV